eukprot:5010427-Amphidinium_carterae.1
MDTIERRQEGELIPENFDCTEDKMTKLQTQKTIYSMYFKYHPTRSYDKFAPALATVYNNFELRCARGLRRRYKPMLQDDKYIPKAFT